MEYKLVAQFQDDDRSWPVTIYSHYETFRDAEKAGYDIVKKYDGNFPRIEYFQVLEADRNEN